MNNGTDFADCSSSVAFHCSHCRWCNLHNLDPETPTKKYKLPSQPNYEVSLYGSSVMAVAADGVTHDNPAKVDVTCGFWGL